ncbi:MAG: response regulator transcription factor [Candidatus Korobacteraceae bacterium]
METYSKEVISVCIFSSHPLGMNELRASLTEGFRLEEWKEAEGKIPRARVYVMDADGPERQVHEVLRGLFSKRPTAQVILIADRFREETAFTFLRLGVKGLVTLSELRQCLPRSVRDVANGGYWVPRTLLSRFVDCILNESAGKKTISSDVNLSRRERDVIGCLLDNLSNKEIATKLNISERTAKFHVSNLLTKYGVGRRADLILLWYQKEAGRSPTSGGVASKNPLQAIVGLRA